MAAPVQKSRCPLCNGAKGGVVHLGGLENALRFYLLNDTEHAYQRRKFCESRLYFLLSKIENAALEGGSLVGMFADI